MTIDKLIGDLSQHLASRVLRETAQFQENKYKARVLDDLVEAGEETPEGHYVFAFEGGLPIGRDEDGRPRIVNSVKREKRAPLHLDPDMVDKLLPDELRAKVYKTTVVVPDMSDAMTKTLLDALTDLGLIAGTEIERVIDEDELLSLNYEEQVSDADLKKMYVGPPEDKIVYALKVSYAK